MQLHSTPVLAAILMLAASTAPAADAQAPQPAGVIFENVRIFNGVSDRLSAPSNVLVVGNVIKTISGAPIAEPPVTSVTRIQGGGRTLCGGHDGGREFGGGLDGGGGRRFQRLSQYG